MTTNSSALRTKLLRLATVGTLPLVVLAAFGLAYVFEQQTVLAHERALETTRALATAVEAELERSITALRVLATSEALDRGDVREFDRVARRALEAQASWQIVNLSDPSGRQLVNTFFAPGAPLPAQQLEQESFRRTLETRAPQIGRLVAGRKGPAFPLRIPVERDGTVRYVLTAVEDPNAIQRILSRQRVPDAWVISVFDADGTRIARSRANEQFVGTKGHPSLRALLSQGATEGIGMTTTLEGTRVFTAFTRLPSGWAVTMGLPTAEVYSTAWKSVGLFALAILASLAVGLFAAMLLSRRINEPMARLRGAAAALAEGVEPALPAAGIREIDEVGASLADASRRLNAVAAEKAELLERAERAREQAEAANSAKDQFLAMLGHELRNPLAALSNAAALLEMGQSDASVGKRALEVVRRQVGHLTRLTDDLLDAARALLGKIALRREPVDLARIVGNALNTLASAGKTGEHAVECRLEEVWVLGDEVRLDQVICNLVVNAVKYTPPGKRIKVSTWREGNDAMLVVSDEGQGLSPELAARAFDLFVQGEMHLDRAQGGLGVGLTLVRRLVELHGGSVGVHSRGENLGSEFFVRLPVTSERPAASRAEPGATPARACRILVVEDNDDARDTLAALLRSLGHEVLVARDGATALGMAREARPDIALIDVGLPGMDGLEVARQLRADPAQATFLVALTGYGAPEDRARTLAAGFDEHVAKPLDLARLSAIVARCDAAVG